MIELPHRPDAAKLGAARARVEEFLEDAAKRTAEERARKNAGFFATVASQHLLRGVFALSEGKRADGRDAIRAAQADMIAACEMGHLCTPWDVSMYVLVSAAVDASSAHFFASLPNESWIDPAKEGMDWPIAQARLIRALWREQGEVAGEWLDLLDGLTIDRALPEGLKPDAEELRNWCGILRALHARNSGDFNRLLGERMEIRAASLKRVGGNAPINLIDLHGIGLVAMARKCGLAVTVRHPYLPSLE